MVKHFRQPQRPRKNTLIAGPVAISEALRDGPLLDRIYVDNQARGAAIEALKRLAVQHQVPVNYVPEAKLRSFNLDDHGGCVAIIAKVQYQDLSAVVSQVIDRGEAPLLLLLDGVTDIRNIGGIARTAFCCGVHALILPDKGVGALNEDAILASAGALEKIAVCRVQSLMKTAEDLHLYGIKVVATQMEAEVAVYDCDLSVPCAIVMGSEEKGIFQGLMKICDERIRIPMPGQFESLNVSVATGMILYEAVRQRK